MEKPSMILEEAVFEVVDGVSEGFAEVGQKAGDDVDEAVDDGIGTAVAATQVKFTHLAFSFSTAPSLSSTVFVGNSFSGTPVF